jgi:hypothetical protein
MLCKIWGSQGGEYEECLLLGYKNPVRTSQETHYVSVTESSQLMLCKTWGFHGGDYEECRLLGYYAVCLFKNRYSVCKIWGFHGGDYEEWCLRYSVVFLRNVRRFLVAANVLSPQILITLMMEALRFSEISQKTAFFISSELYC